MKKEAGFTLIEVLIAMGILSFGLLAMANMQAVAIQVNASGNRLSQGITLVQDKIEDLMALPFAHADLADATPVGTCQAHTEPTPPTGYTLTWCVDNTTVTSKTVTVTAAWNMSFDKDYSKAKSFVLSFVRNTLQ